MSDSIAATIAACKTTDTGITTHLAEKLWPMLGHTFPAVVTVRVSEHTEDEDGPKALKLQIDSIEPGLDDLTNRHLRELQRALYFTRNPQPHLDDPDEVTIRDIVNRGGRLTATQHQTVMDWLEEHADELVANTPGLDGITITRADRP